jgi:hypothetical protein
MMGGRRTDRPIVRSSYSRDSPLNELARSKPSDVMSLYSTSAKNFGSTHVAFGFLMGRVSFVFGLTTVSSCFRIWLETVRDHPVPTLPNKNSPGTGPGPSLGRKLGLNERGAREIQMASHCSIGSGAL